jgi:hypothetical protein
MNALTPPKNWIAAFWFATIAFLCLALTFRKVPMAYNGVILYQVLPTVAATFAGRLWGGAILDRSKTDSLSCSLARGVGTAAGAFAIFAVLFAVTLPFVEDGWSFSQSGGLFVLTSTLGILLAAPIILLGGMLAGVSLYLLVNNSAQETGRH